MTHKEKWIIWANFHIFFNFLITKTGHSYRNFLPIDEVSVSSANFLLYLLEECLSLTEDTVSEIAPNNECAIPIIKAIFTDTSDPFIRYRLCVGLRLNPYLPINNGSDIKYRVYWMLHRVLPGPNLCEEALRGRSGGEPHSVFANQMGSIPGSSSPDTKRLN